MTEKKLNIVSIIIVTLNLLVTLATSFVLIISKKVSQKDTYQNKR